MAYSKPFPALNGIAPKMALFTEVLHAFLPRIGFRDSDSTGSSEGYSAFPGLKPLATPLQCQNLQFKTCCVATIGENRLPGNPSPSVARNLTTGTLSSSGVSWLPIPWDFVKGPPAQVFLTIEKKG